MITDATTIRTYFGKLGLDAEIADIYLALYTHGPQHISGLARTSGVERTRIYRLIDTLLESNLIELESHDARGIIKAAPIANLRILISQKEQDLRSLQDELGLIEQALARNALSSPAAHIQMYYGLQGLRTMLLSQSESKDDVYGYETGVVQTYADEKLLQQWRANTKNQQIRLCATTTDHDCHIRGDTVYYYQQQDSEFFGISIKSADIAEGQRALFKALWQAAS